MPAPSDAAVHAWVRLNRAHAFTFDRVQAALKAAGHPPLEWYDVLLELERGGPMRPRDLQVRLLIAQSNLSRLLDRMEGVGLISTAPCADDRRGQTVSVTEAGRRLRHRMWPVYGRAIEHAVGRPLQGDASILGDLLGRLLAPAVD